jgi:hypothetical protein
VVIVVHGVWLDFAGFGSTVKEYVVFEVEQDDDVDVAE